MRFEPIIGLEIHIQLKTARKMFCDCDANVWEVEPNTHVCPVCLGLPGALPVVNQKAIEQAMMVGLALNCEIAKETYFERKNYFYPDLPKGYQISQYRAPLATGGSLELKIKNEELRVGITRVHLEEDTAKSIHSEGSTLLDFNKSGIPLLEVVSAPDLHSAAEAVAYGKKIQQLVRYLEVSEADMEKGQMRLEANVSVRQLDSGAVRQQELPDYRVEIKNINSFRFLERALEYEIKRQSEALRKGQKLVQETRGFDEKRGVTFSQREKEYAHDYRYFPEPDLPPIQLDSKTVRQLGSKLPELPDPKVTRFVKEYNLSDYEASILTETKEKADYFEEVVKEGIEAKESAGWIINRPEEIKDLNPKGLSQKIRKQKEEVISDAKALEPVIEKVIAENPEAVADFKKGKKEALKFLIGQVMRSTAAKADPQLTDKLLRKALD